MQQLFLVFMFLMLPWSAWAANTHGSSSESSERAKWFGDMMEPFVVTGCVPPVPSSSATLAAPACYAYVRATTGELVYVTQPAKSVGPLAGGNGTFWLALHRNSYSTVADWTRQAGSHWLWRKVEPVNNQSPATPADALIVAKITVAGGVVTLVVDQGAHSPGPQAVVRTSQFSHLTGGARIQAAIDALPPSGGTVHIDPGIYVLTSALKIGNGGPGVLSTRQGVHLKGAGYPTDDATLTSVWLRWEGGDTDAGRMLWVQGPLIGWGLENLFLDGGGTADVGLFVQSAQMGEVSNVIIRNFNFYGVYSTCVPTFGGNNTDSLHTRWQNVRVWNQTPYGAEDSVGINLDGSGATCDTDLQMFYNTFILVAGVDGYGLRLGASDTNFFWGLHVFADVTAKAAITFDYSNAGSDLWPCNTHFFGSTVGPNSTITHTGAPGALMCGNLFWGWAPQGGANEIPTAQGVASIVLEPGNLDLVLVPGMNAQASDKQRGDLKLHSTVSNPRNFIPAQGNTADMGTAVFNWKNLYLAGGVIRQIRAASIDTPLALTDYYLAVDTTGANRTVTLLSAAAVPGREFVFVNAGANDLILQTVSAQNITSAAGSGTTHTLETPNESVTLMSNGVGWHLTAGN